MEGFAGISRKGVSGRSRAGRARAPRRQRGRGRAVLIERVEADEFLSLADESNFHDQESLRNAVESEEIEATELTEADGTISDSAYLSGIRVEKLGRPFWYKNFYEPLLFPPPELKMSANSVVARCKLCVLEEKSHTFNSASLGSLTNLQRHLVRKHKTEWEQYVRDRNTKVTDGQSTLPFSSKVTTLMSKVRQEELKNALATMIVIDNMPPTSVLKPGLRHFVSVR